MVTVRACTTCITRISSGAHSPATALRSGSARASGVGGVSENAGSVPVSHCQGVQFSRQQRRQVVPQVGGAAQQPRALLRDDAGLPGRLHRLSLVLRQCGSLQQPKSQGAHTRFQAVVAEGEPNLALSDALWLSDATKWQAFTSTACMGIASSGPRRCKQATIHRRDTTPNHRHAWARSNASRLAATSLSASRRCSSMRIRFLAAVIWSTRSASASAARVSARSAASSRACCSALSACAGARSAHQTAADQALIRRADSDGHGSTVGRLLTRGREPVMPGLQRLRQQRST